jgi:hypothetical protein
MRETLERFVEEKLLNSVVSRFRTGVQTLSLKQVTVEGSDYHKIFWAMKRASTFSGHDTAVARRTSVPTPQEMRKDIESLRVYEKELKRRQEKMGHERELHEAPPTGRTGQS